MTQIEVDLKEEEVGEGFKERGEKGISEVSGGSSGELTSGEVRGG